MSDPIKTGILDACTAGEIALVSSQLFRSHQLRLYHLSGREQKPSKYLVASRNAPVLIINLTYNRVQWGGGCEGQPWYIGGSPLILPMIWIPQENMKLGQVDDVLSYLEEMLEKNWGDYCGYEFGLDVRKPWDLYCDYPCDFYCKKCPASSAKRSLFQPVCDSIPIHEELHDTLAKLRMIRQQADHTWRPTVYGASLGLIDGYLDTGKDDPCHTFFFLPGCESRLQEAVDWIHTRGKYAPDSLTLAQRLILASQGLPGNYASTIELVRAFGAMPMADYMAASPDMAEKLRRQFGEMATYQEAADRLYRFCLASDGSKANNKYCEELIVNLVLPIFEASPQPVQEFLRKPFPTVLMGTAMVSGQPCLLWNTEDILDKALDGNTDKRPTSCQTLLEEMLWYCADADGEIMDDNVTGKNYAVVFRLLVEPFALMNQAANSSNR